MFKKILKLLIRGPSTVFNYIWNFIQLKYYRVQHGPHIKINGRIHIHGRRGGIQIGDYFVMNSGLAYNPTSGGTASHLSVGPDGKLIIGDHVGMSNIAITAKKEVRIDDYVMIGSNCMITDTDFHSTDAVIRKQEIDNWFLPSTPPKISQKTRSTSLNTRLDEQSNRIRNRIDAQSDDVSSPSLAVADELAETNGLTGPDGLVVTDELAMNDRLVVTDGGVKTSPVHIGNSVFIGARCILLKGTNIAPHAVIGAGTVLTAGCKIGAGEVWTGSHATRL